MRRTVAALAVISLSAVLAFASTDENNPPEAISLGLLANLYEPVHFDHAAHVKVVDDCASCHHQRFGEPKPCSDCHEDEVAPSAFVHELHWEAEEWTSCHRLQSTGDLRCVSCHPVEPDPARLEVIGLKGAHHGSCLRCHGQTGSDDWCTLCHPDRSLSQRKDP